MIPQLLLTLSPSGDLQIELPANGGRRIVPVKPSQLEETARRILVAQLYDIANIKIGKPSDPSVWQVIHWNRHVDAAVPVRDSRCPFCRDDNIEDAIRLAGEAWKEPSQKTSGSRPIPIGNGSASVRRLPPRARQLREQHSTINPEDFGI